MNDAQSDSPTKTSPAKLALIGVLALVLAGVLFMPDGSDEPTAEPVNEPAESAEGTAGSDQKQAKVIRNEPKWPRFDFEKIVRLDPFAMPKIIQQRLYPDRFAADGSKAEEVDDHAVSDAEAAAEAEATRRREFLASLQQDKVKFILRNRNGATAVIGEHVVREGDVIEGFRVLRIEPDGVVVEVVPIEGVH